MLLKSGNKFPCEHKPQKNAGMIGGEGMQMVWGLSYAPSNPAIVYLVKDNAQTWKSEDGGKTWEMKHKGFMAKGGISLTVNPNNENTVFVAGCNQKGNNDSIAVGIYRTTNGGDSWELVYKTPFYRLEDKKGGTHFAFTTTGTIYAGTHEEGLLKSIDGGDTWTPLDLLTTEKILDVKIHPQDNSIVFVATEFDLYKIKNETTVTSIGRVGGVPDFARVIQINPKNPLIIYVTVGTYGVYKSIDGGNFFKPQNGIVESDYCNKGNASLDLSSFGKPATYLSMSPVNPDYLYVNFRFLGGNKPYYTHDGGVHWCTPSIMDKGNLINELTNGTGGHYHSHSNRFQSCR